MLRGGSPDGGADQEVPRPVPQEQVGGLEAPLRVAAFQPWLIPVARADEDRAVIAPREQVPRACHGDARLAVARVGGICHPHPAVVDEQVGVPAAGDTVPAPGAPRPPGARGEGIPVEAVPPEEVLAERQTDVLGKRIVHAGVRHDESTAVRQDERGPDVGAFPRPGTHEHDGIMHGPVHESPGARVPEVDLIARVERGSLAQPSFDVEGMVCPAVFDDGEVGHVSAQRAKALRQRIPVPLAVAPQPLPRQCPLEFKDVHPVSRLRRWYRAVNRGLRGDGEGG